MRPVLLASILFLRFAVTKEIEQLSITTPVLDESVKNASLQATNNFYTTLYNRLYSEDYGFAKFGESCDPGATTNSFEDLLDYGATIIRDQQEDGQYRRSVEHHLRPKLRNFFYRSQKFCDFRKLLICDNPTKKCACPPKSFGIGRSGGCQVHIGKRCDFTETELSGFGIPTLKSYKINITCIGGTGSECVSSFGAAKKLCRCKSRGQQGQCGGEPTGNYSEQAIELTAFDKLRRMKVTSVMLRLSEHDYFLSPKEIKNELVLMMNRKGIYEPEQREVEAEELYSKIESHSYQEQLVVRDIFLRRFANLQHGFMCEDEGRGVVLDNPPRGVNNIVQKPPTFKDVKSWQEYILKDLVFTGKGICDLTKYLACKTTRNGSETTSSTTDPQGFCRCREDSVYEEGFCNLKVGQPCGDDYEGVYQFDPLKDLTILSPPEPPKCMKGSVCEGRKLFFSKHCWCKEKDCKKEKKISNREVEKVVEILEGKLNLDLGKSCDPRMHAKLLNPKDLEVRDAKLRHIQLRNLASRPVHFCNITKLLNCSEQSKTCVCQSALILESGQCRAPNLVSCSAHFPQGRSFYPGGNPMLKIEAIFGTQFRPECISNTTCRNQGKCQCKNGMAGMLCDEPKSVFATVLDSTNVRDGSEHDEDKINKIFYDLNLLTHEMEQTMGLGHGDKCDPKPGKIADMVYKFYNEISNDPKAFHQYEKVVNWLQRLAPTEQGTCNQFHGLSCHNLTKKCVCPYGTILQDKICKVLLHEECEVNPSASWIPRCGNNARCVQHGGSSKGVCGCNEGVTGENCSIHGRTSCTDKITVTIGNLTFTECLDGHPDDDDAETHPPPPPPFDDRLYKYLKNLVDTIIDRNRSLHSPCDFKAEQNLDKWVPTLPMFSKQDMLQLPFGGGVTMNYLTTLDNLDLEFCDRRKYLECDKDTGKCGCRASVLVEQGGECRLREHDFCVEEPEEGALLHRNIKLHFKCEEGTVCRKIPYQTATCVRRMNNDG